MGDRGRVLHLRGADGAKRLEALRVPHQVLARNRRWISFVPARRVEPDTKVIAQRCAADLADVWFDEDVGIAIQIAGADGFASELSLPLGEPGLGAEDKRFLGECARRRLLTRTAADEITRRAGRTRGRSAWLLRHGVEELFGFPFTGSMPVTTIAGPPARPAPPPPPGPPATWNAEDWGALIRSPKLDDNGAGEDELARWRQMVRR